MMKPVNPNTKKTTGKAKKKKKPSAPKVSATLKPENLGLNQWQITLRKQAAEKEPFNISFVDRKTRPGDYLVENPGNARVYKAVYRGPKSPWNYCSCMDFKTNQLGTCKHLESIKLWLKRKRLGIPGKEIPPYTSVYLSYQGEREVKIRIGSEHKDEFGSLAEDYFTPQGTLKPEAYYTFSSFLTRAQAISDSFRCYGDALDHIINVREKTERQQMLATKYPDGKVDGLLRAKLYPYQHEGILFATAAGKCIIADEMGLGKTIQAIGTTELLRKENYISSALIVCPTSLKYQWKSEIRKFTDADAIVVEGNHLKRKELYQSGEFYKIVSYNALCNDIKILGSFDTDMLIMDEAQRLKNWNTQIAQAMKKVETGYSVILSGTPLENKIEELYSVIQYADPFCLGPYHNFMDAFTMNDTTTGKRLGYKQLNKVGERLRGRLIRRRKKDVELQLPERTDKVLLVPMTIEQMGMHDEFNYQVVRLIHKWARMKFLSEKDRKKLLLNLNMMRMVCDSTYILDQKSRFDTKINELMQIISNVIESGDEKIVVFSQWERMTRIVTGELENAGIGYEYLHGGIPSEKRKNQVENFTTNPESRVFVSTDAGSTGLNLQVASIIINLDLPWNPAVLEQRIARIYRIGQRRNIQVINFVSKDTIEERMLGTLSFKTSLFEGVLDQGEDSVFLEESKFDKFIHLVEEVTSISSDKQEQPAPSSIQKDDQEEFVPSPAPEPAAIPTPSSAYEPDESANMPAPEDVMQQGFAFFSNLAKTLSSPSATEQLLSSIVEEDKETGQTTLRIPVENKEMVKDTLTLLGKLFSGMKIPG